MLHVCWTGQHKCYRMECDQVKCGACTAKTAWVKFSADALEAWKMFTTLSTA